MWYELPGKDTDVVLSTKVTIARNIKGFAFPSKMSDADRENAMGMIRQAGGNMGFNFIRCEEMENPAKEDIFNQYYCKYGFLNSTPKTAFLLGKKEGLGVLLGDREHMSIVSLTSGDDVTSAYKAAEEVATNFEKEMEIAYSDKLGFLTSDIRYIGTGLTISFLVCLPGIEKTQGALATLGKRAEKYDWQIRPILQADGNKEPGMYEIKSIATLGVSESDMVTRASKVIADAVKLERSCRSNIYKKKSLIVEDQFYRSYALLKYARRIEAAEVLLLLGWIRMGLGLINDSEISIDWDTINVLTHKTRRSYTELSPVGRKSVASAVERADRIRMAFKKDSERG